MRIQIRFFVEGPAPEQAKKRAEALLDAVGRHGERPATPALKPYQDMKGWHEGIAAVAVSPDADARALLKRIGTDLATGWKWVRDGDGGLCATDFGSEIALDGVKWIELDLVP